LALQRGTKASFQIAPNAPKSGTCFIERLAAEVALTALVLVAGDVLCTHFPPPDEGGEPAAMGRR
jgi:hypothetical protein